MYTRYGGDYPLVCVCVCYRSTGRHAYSTGPTKVKESAHHKDQNKCRDRAKTSLFESYDSLQLTVNTLVGACGSNTSPAGQKRFRKTFGGSSAASSTTNYRSLSFTSWRVVWLTSTLLRFSRGCWLTKLAGVAITYFDPKTARGSVD